MTSSTIHIARVVSYGVVMALIASPRAICATSSSGYSPSLVPFVSGPRERGPNERCPRGQQGDQSCKGDRSV
jgi:hypothetical protein